MIRKNSYNLKARRINLVCVANSENANLPNDFIKIMFLQYKFSALYSLHTIAIIILYIIPYKELLNQSGSNLIAPLNSSQLI